MLPKTKIVATLGPACEDEKTLKKLLKSGVSIPRFNLKHNKISWHQEKIHLVRKIAKELNRPIGILIDLQGPDIRIGTFEQGSIYLKKGDCAAFVQDKKDNPDPKKYKTILIDYINMFRGLENGYHFFIDDGNFEFEKLEDSKKYVLTKVMEGGELKERKGVNLPEIQSEIPILEQKDFRAIDLAIEEKAEFIALSFVKSPKDILKARNILKKKGGFQPKIIAKIEKPEAVRRFDAILKVVDGIMIARGDLGIEACLEKLPLMQKTMIQKCRLAGKPVITATHMLESMREHRIPTRAEVTDVANAIRDGTDAIMLSGETASGKYPIESVEMMVKIANAVEKTFTYPLPKPKIENQEVAVTLAAHELDMSTNTGVNRAKAFVVLTETGNTARLLSRLKPQIPIIAVTENKTVKNQLAISWGIEPYFVEFGKNPTLALKKIFTFLKRKKAIKKGELIILLMGEILGKPGGTSTIALKKVV